MRTAAATLLLVLALPLAQAGTAEQPELVDAAGDCEFAPGNLYMDIVSAWVSDETAEGFNVNLQLSQWTEPIAPGAGFTVQFVHQGVQFGIVAAYLGPMGWYYANGYITEEEASDFTETTGSFSAPVITVLFLKSNFPHTDMTDNRLVSFTAGSVDLKAQVPFFFAPPTPLVPPSIPCDSAAGEGTYTFTVGGHSSHMAGNETAAATPTTTNATAQGQDETASPVEPASAPANKTPGPGATLVALAVVAAALLARRQRA